MKRLFSYAVEGFRNVIMLGPPGAGKGSFASRSSKELGIPHLTTGDMIRAEIKMETSLGLEFKGYSDRGELVPDDLVVALILGQLEDVVNSETGCLLDGFPRTIPQLDALLEAGYEIGGDDSDFVAVNLTQDEEIIVEKIISRRVCSVCGETYNYAHIVFEGGVYEMPPLVPEVEGVCDGCGGVDTLILRDDDKEDVVRNRLEVYHNQTAPLIDYFDSQGVLTEFVINGGTKMLLPSFLELLETL